MEGAPSKQRRTDVLVPACGCCGRDSWCSRELALPQVNWTAVFGSEAGAALSVPTPAQQTDLGTSQDWSAPQPSLSGACELACRSAPLNHLGPGGCSRFRLRGEFDVLLVDDEAQLPAALAELRASLQDCVVAIDLEWRPDHGPAASNRVALLQLASARVALLVRTCRMRFRLPSALASFLRDPSVMLVGFAWNNGDEHKMTSTFGMGRSDFGCFVDLQEVATAMGYHNYGLSSLAQRVLGTQMPKSFAVSMSNWETASGLTEGQISYGALDALVAGQVLRGLRLWHSSPSPCTACRQALGSAPAPPALRCTALGCNKRFKSINSMIAHGRSLGHCTPVVLCNACGRHM